MELPPKANGRPGFQEWAMLLLRQGMVADTIGGMRFAFPPYGPTVLRRPGEKVPVIPVPETAAGSQPAGSAGPLPGALPKAHPTQPFLILPEILNRMES
jgi:hypothetical protein